MLMHNAIINYCSIVLFIICANKAEIIICSACHCQIICIGSGHKNCII